MHGQQSHGLVSTILDDGNHCNIWPKDCTLMLLYFAQMAKLLQLMTIFTLSKELLSPKFNILMELF